MRISDIFLNLFSSGKERDCVMATTHEQIAGDICVQIGHLPESAKDKILKLVVAKALPGKAVYVSRKKEAPSVTCNDVWPIVNVLSASVEYIEQCDSDGFTTSVVKPLDLSMGRFRLMYGL